MYEEFREIVGEEGFSELREDRLLYSRDSSFFYETPLCVLRPYNRDQAVKVVRLAARDKIPIIPRGAGTNPCGEVVGKAIIIDLARMNRIIEVNEQDMYAVVEPGVVRDELNKALEKHRLFFPPDPASSQVATIGGMVSNNSSGLHAVKYGTTKDYVLSLEVVLPTGELIETGTLALKSSSGYDLRRLFVGSEGTLGVFTKITLHLLPIPEEARSVVFSMSSLQDLGDIQKAVHKLVPAAFEFMDDICVQVISKRHGQNLGEAQALIAVEFQGTREEVLHHTTELEKVVGTTIDFPGIWEIRKGLVPMLTGYCDKKPLAITEDIGVPVSKAPEAISKIKDIYREAGYEVAIYGHLGDGNLHMRVFGEPSPELEGAAEDVYSYVIDAGGTISSEHGIGRLRTGYMERQHGSSLELMKRIKKAIDPENIMNPGCLFG